MQFRMTETLAHGYLSENAQQELSNEYQQKSLHSCALDENSLSIGRVNQSTLRVPQESIVCYSHTFENNLGIKLKFTKKLKRVVVWHLINISTSNIFQKICL